ncbi:MAG TPA: C40 family peptidase [Gaiellaceae bacterium]|jgi:cell wall-associated NlpC family hydrolase|nr:C40 family peptidase [Gaiellaceae bacterium]
MRTRLLLLLLSLTFALTVALVRPLPGRADVDPSRTPEPTPPADPTSPVPGLIELRMTGRLGRRGKAVSHVAHALHAPLGQRVVSFARHLIGVRYLYGGASPRTGFDCSGFVRYVYGHFGVALAHSSFADFVRGRRVGRWQLKPGDLVFFDGADHVGIYVGRGRFIHAPHTGAVVRISTMSGWYGARYDGARRVT